MRHVISVHDLGVEEIVNVLDRAEDMLTIARGEASSDLLKGKVLATTFSNHQHGQDYPSRQP